MTAMPRQPELFAAARLPEGLRYEPEFLGEDDEAALVEIVRTLPLEAMQYKAWRAKRRIVSYGGRYDFTTGELEPAGPIPEFLEPLRARIAAWAGIPAERFRHALIAEYAAGTQLGWHRDVPQFEAVVGVSLAGPARLRLRPYPPRGNRRALLALDLEPRSAYALIGPARWGWQHAISPTKTLRYSITMRTLRDASR